MNITEQLEESVTLAGRWANNTGSCVSDPLRFKNQAEGATVDEPQTQDEMPADASSNVKFIFLSGDSDPLQQGNTERRFWVHDQQDPEPNEHPAIWPLVMKDMVNRDCLGRKRYGTPLQPHNGRDMLMDAYEEALDLVAYLRGAIFERDGS